jgi:hypothetical protein
MMKKILVSVCLSALTAMFVASSSKSMAGNSGASVGHGGSSVSASRDGSRGIDGRLDSGGYVNAAGDRAYDDIASWVRDLQRSWSSSEPVGNKTIIEEPGATKFRSVEQVSEARAVSTVDKPALAEATNVNATEQRN